MTEDVNSPKITIKKLSQCTFEQGLQLQNLGFQNYLIPRKDAEMPQYLKKFNSVDPRYSPVVFVGDKPAGFIWTAMTTVRGKKWSWNGGTGVSPEFRKHGIGKILIDEYSRILDELVVDCTYLEVLTENIGAIKLYERVGFHIIGTATTLNKTDAFDNIPFRIDSQKSGSYYLREGHPWEILKLPFYHEKHAWPNQWFNQPASRSLTVYDDTGKAVGYSLFSASYDENGELVKKTLHQCEVDPSQMHKEAIINKMLSYIYTPFDEAYIRYISECLNPDVIHIALNESFTIKHEQYIMKR